jgi:hypothetical protein
MIDERTHLGFTNWRSACRASGLSIESLTFFTFELLPTAVVGALVGALLVLAVAIQSRHRFRLVSWCLATPLLSLSIKLYFKNYELGQIA